MEKYSQVTIKNKKQNNNKKQERDKLQIPKTKIIALEMLPTLKGIINNLCEYIRKQVKFTISQKNITCRDY